MDRALWLLLGLRLRAWLRRLRRALSTVRGILVCGFGLLVLAAWLLPAVLLTPPEAPQLEQTRRLGPLVLVAFCVLNVVFSPGERSITFSPAEVNLLFPTPFSRRQLLLYKISAGVGAALISASFLALLTRQHTASYLAGFIGLSLTLVFWQLFSMVLALVANVVGARAFNRRRRLVLVALAAALAVALFQAGWPALEQGWQPFLAELEDTPVMRVLLAPVAWLIRASTAEQLWPDLVQWAALGLALDGGLLLLVLALDAHYLEAAAAASEKAYARLQRLRRGSPAVSLPRWGTVHRSLPALPFWGGVGPLLWRQLTTAWRSVWSLVLVVVLFGILLAPTVLSLRRHGSADAPAPTVAVLLVAMAFFVSPMLPFDFRGDVDRLDLLKALPVPAWRLVLGQLLAPVLCVTLAQLLLLAGAQVLGGQIEPLVLASVAFLLPVNLLLFELENLLFLWFPSRMTNLASGDFQMLGRHMLQWLAKFLVLGLVLGLALGAGLLAYFVSGRSFVAAGLAAWLMMAAGAAGLLPLLVLAFKHFDVARDVPS